VRDIVRRSAAATLADWFATPFSPLP